MPCECRTRKALGTALDRLPMHAVAEAGPKFWDGGGAIVYQDWYLDAQAALSDPCPCEQLRADNAKWLKLLQARTLEKERISDDNERLINENADIRQRLNDLKEWAKIANEFAWAHERTCPRHDADESCNCGLDSFIGSPRPVVESFRTEIADLRKQARESAYKAAQMRGIVDAAEKLLCGLYEDILPLSVHTREVMRDIRNALGDERVDSSQDRPMASGGSR